MATRKNATTGSTVKSSLAQAEADLNAAAHELVLAQECFKKAMDRLTAAKTANESAILHFNSQFQAVRVATKVVPIGLE